MAVPYEQVVAIAERVANSFSNLWQLSFEDRVQECMLKWMELEARGMYVSKQLLFFAFRNRMIDLARRYKADSLVEYDAEAVENVAGEERHPPETFVVALPKEWGPTRRFTRILFEKGCVRDAADVMGIPYTRADHWWRRVKRKVREMAESGNYSPEDVLMEVELYT